MISRGRVLLVMGGEAQVELVEPVWGRTSLRARDEIGVRVGEAVVVEAHPASPMGVFLLMLLVPLLLGFGGCAVARVMEWKAPGGWGSAAAMISFVALLVVERWYRRYASPESTIVARQGEPSLG